MPDLVNARPPDGSPFVAASSPASTTLQSMSAMHLLLEDALRRGAIGGESLERTLQDGSSLRHWLEAKGWMVRVPTPEGVAYVLSPQAKRWLGVRSSWITRPELAARQVLHRRIVGVLEQWGWYQVRGGVLPYLCYRRPDGRPTYVVASRRGLSARTVRRMLDRCRAPLLREGAVLLVISPDCRWLKSLAMRSNGLLTLAPLAPFVQEPDGACLRVQQ